uniref:Putative site-specific DNA endonuclease n=1 Tax=Dicloster acuatus TaxID=91190 RepID=A0A097KQL2_9CHLO|nr:putative site-specific DNA endonuclease [Dicloster acuatus]YP_009106655.1 putative site-specific DNA endonuclease [Dicloster acuatus]AIT95466.1 putative site-specific DNA endonuclease [Dicloster acuatus]AIT95469.1 putative site-specific DNA endonuclease [Dicloster acuatus]
MIKNRRHGYHLNSSYWQNYKKTVPDLSDTQFQIAVGMICEDATMRRVSKEAFIKFEQGYKQKDFVFHLFDNFGGYTFVDSPKTRFDDKKKKIKSYWFRTFSHKNFTPLFESFYKLRLDGKYRKTITPNLVFDLVTPRSLAYWIMSDGSLQNDSKSMILHTQSFTEKENYIVSDELNRKFGFHSVVKTHKTNYFVVFFPAQDAQLLFDLIQPFMIPSMWYKLPKMKS